MTQRERDRQDRRLAAARKAVGKLTPSQKSTLFRETGQCTCALLGAVVKASPLVGLSAGLGALVGGLLGAVVGMDAEKHPVLNADGLCTKTSRKVSLFGQVGVLPDNEFTPTT